MRYQWDQTITHPVDVRVDSGDGCLLQIHPLKISGDLIELKAARTLVGRDASCGYCIPDASVSRQHAVIECVDDEWKVTDLESTNGTCVNETRVTSAAIVPGDRVQFGSHIFKFLSTNHIEVQYHEALYSMITRDGLTGILNRRYFADIIQREFCRAVATGKQLSLIVFDIDNFKRVNDTHGHLAGDEILQEMSRRVLGVIADHDVFARYGGEEFAILLQDKDMSEACELAERCRAVVEATPFTTCMGHLPISVSLGVADVTSLDQKVDNTELFRAADAKMYEAKRSGRNRVCG